jgi:hypothetical protein
MGNLLLEVRLLLLFSRVADVSAWPVLVVVLSRIVFVWRIIVLLHGSSLEDHLIYVVLNLRGQEVGQSEVEAVSVGEVASQLIWVVALEDLDVLLHAVSNVNCDGEELLLVLGVALRCGFLHLLVDFLFLSERVVIALTILIQRGLALVVSHRRIDAFVGSLCHYLSDARLTRPKQL